MTPASRLEQLVSVIDRAAALPMTVKEVLDISYDPKSDAQALAGAISKDPVLSSKLLQVANSSFFAFLWKAADIRTAVVRLGVKGVRNVTLALGVAKLYSSPVDSDGYSRPGVWRHSVAVGMINELLCGVVRAREAKELAGQALLAGLVHDIGIILVDQYVSKRFEPLPALAASLSEPLYRVEKPELDFDHQELGALVLLKWRFPARIASAVGAHHGRASLESGDLLAQMTAMSEFLATAKKAGYCDAPRIQKDLFMGLSKRMGLDADGIAMIKGTFDQKYAEALAIFDVTGAAPTHSKRIDVDGPASGLKGPPRPP